MQKSHHYSEKKFQKFTLDKQRRILLTILKEIEKNYADIDTRSDLIASFKACLSYVKDGFEEYREAVPVLDNKRELSYKLTSIRHALHDRFRDEEFAIYSLDGANKEQPKLPIVVILDNLRSAFNVGSIFRTSECVGVERVICCGITPLPDNKDMRDTTMGTVDYVNWESCKTTHEAIERLRTEGYHIFALETAEPSTDIYEYEIETPLALVLGNEALGIDKETLNLCDGILRIPVRGFKNSLNVAVSYAVVIYELLRKLEEKEDDK